MDKKEKNLVLVIVLITLAIGVIGYFSAVIVEKKEQSLMTMEKVGAESDVYDSIANDEIELESIDLNEKREIIGEMNLRLKNNNTIIINNDSTNLFKSLINNL